MPLIAKATETYHLSGRSLIQIRRVWTAAALLLLLPMLVSWYLYYSALQSVCATCLVTPSLVETLQGMGIDIRLWTLWQLAKTVMVGAGWVGAGTAIFALRSYDQRAVLMSILLMMVGPGFGGIPLDLAAVQPEWEDIFRAFSYFSVLGLLPLAILFPNGRLAPRWSLWLVLYLFILFFPTSFLRGSQLNWVNWPMPAGLIIVFVPFLFTLLIVPIYRYRKVFTHLERQQTRWAVLGFLLAAAGIITTMVIMIGAGGIEQASREKIVIYELIQSLGYGLSPLMIPIFIGMAILRSRLWDIDVLIRRTLVYAVLSASLGLVYFGGVVLLETLLRPLAGGESQLAIILTTLAIAALVAPLRRRIQDFIDRRFYRQKYDAEQALAEFAAAARSETNLEALSAQVVGIVQQTMQPEHASLWLRHDRRSVEAIK
jgi:hypothetical protein